MIIIPNFREPRRRSQTIMDECRVSMPLWMTVKGLQVHAISFPTDESTNLRPRLQLVSPHKSEAQPTTTSAAV